MTKPDLSGIPAALARRPIDPRRGLPVPAVNMQGDDDWDFTVINGAESMRLGKAGLCGLCGTPMGDTATFLGGPPREDLEPGTLSVYTDPPMHEDCASAALTLCPHIRIQHARRATTTRADLFVKTGPGWRDIKPGDWVMTVYPCYGMAVMDEVLAYLPGWDGTDFHAPLRVRRFSYDEQGVLREEPRGDDE